MIETDANFRARSLRRVDDPLQFREIARRWLFDQYVLAGLDAGQNNGSELIVSCGNDEHINVVTIDDPPPIVSAGDLRIFRSQRLRSRELHVGAGDEFRPCQRGRALVPNGAATHDPDFQSLLTHPRPALDPSGRSAAAYMHPIAANRADAQAAATTHPKAR